MGNTIGRLFRVTTYGESHGGGIGVVIDGCPPRVALSLERIQAACDRRRPGQSALTSPRQEADRVECLSGLQNGVTLGTPLAFLVRNQDQRADDYQDLQKIFRPSHADFTTQAKYGIRAASGGGRASARETIARVIAGTVAEEVLQTRIEAYTCVAHVDQIGRIAAENGIWTRDQVNFNLVRCPDPLAAQKMEAAILAAKSEGDTLGGTIRCRISGVPAGLGEPVFDKLQADLGKAMLSLPAVRAFEIGLGFDAAVLRGSEHNDAFKHEAGKIVPASNRSGGIQGGISNGEDILFRVGFKPVSTIFKPQTTVDEAGREITFAPKGRHDPCVVPRAVPIVEAMASIIILDHYLRL